MDAEVHEVKDHSLAAFTRAVGADVGAAGRAGRGLPRALGDAGQRRAGRRRACTVRWPGCGTAGVRVGISTSGPRQADAVRRALAVTVDGEPLFTSFQSTWNVLEPSAGPALAEAAAAGARVIVKEAVANGRLAPGGADSPAAHRVAELAAEADTTVDALAIAAALAQPWAWRVLSGAVDPAQVASNAAAADRRCPTAVAAELAGLAEDPADLLGGPLRPPLDLIDSAASRHDWRHAGQTWTTRRKPRSGIHRLLKIGAGGASVGYGHCRALRCDVHRRLAAGGGPRGAAGRGPAVGGREGGEPRRADLRGAPGARRVLRDHGGVRPCCGGRRHRRSRARPRAAALRAGARRRRRRGGLPAGRPGGSATGPACPSRSGRRPPPRTCRPPASPASRTPTSTSSGVEALLDAVRRCWASLWTDRAVAYRADARDRRRRRCGSRWSSSGWSTRRSPGCCSPRTR